MHFLFQFSLNNIFQKIFALFFLFLTCNVSSQNPGNVGLTNLTAWFNPDILTLGDVQNWPTTYPTLTNQITVSDATSPYPQATNTPAGNISNYNKTLFFNANSSVNAQVLANSSALDLLQNNGIGAQGTFFCAYYLPNASQNGHMLLYNNSPHAIQFRNLNLNGRLAIGLASTNSVNASRDWPEDFLPSIISYKGNRSTANSMTAFKRANIFTNAVASQSSGPTGLYIGQKVGEANSYYSGYIHELIFYNVDLSQNEMDKVHTYLAVKYGITLDNSAGGSQGDYTATDNTIIWDQSVNPGYHHNVIGIGRDDSEGLNQKQSHAFNDNYRVYIDQLAVNNNLNTGSVDNDISYVMMGQNLDAGCSNSISQNEAPAGITSRIAKEWKVTKTNFNQLFNCDIQIDTCTTAGFTVGPVDVNSFRLLVDDDGDFTNATIFSPAGSLIFQYNDGYVTISGISFNEIPNNSTRYITLAYNVLNVGLSASTTSICKGESTNLSLVISNATTPVDVTYTAGASNPVTLTNVTNGYTFSVSPQVTTVYTITGNTNFLKCCSGSSSNTITITVKPLPVVVANASSLVLCQGDSTKLFGTGANSYIWNQSALDQAYVFPNQTTMYTVIGTNSDGCSNDSSVQVSVNPVPNVVVSSDFSEVCFGDPVTLTAAGATSYTWSNGVINGQSFIPSVTTTYTVVGSNQFNCIDSATINIVVHPLPPVLANASDLSICYGDAVTLYGTGATTFQWNNGVTNNLSFIPENSTTYTVVGTDQFLCSSSDNIQIIVFPAIPFSLGQDPIICPQNPIQLSIDQVFSSYLWSTGSTSPQITVNYPGEFYAVVIDENGCAYTDTIKVKMSVDCFPGLYVPNTFTPNEDENNNTFKIFGEYVDFFEMKIYNKWGELIFESNDLNSGWDGTYGGVLCPDGIYSYEIKYSFTTEDASVFRQIGHLSLIK